MMARRRQPSGLVIDGRAHDGTIARNGVAPIDKIITAPQLPRGNAH